MAKKRIERVILTIAVILLMIGILTLLLKPKLDFVIVINDPQHMENNPIKTQNYEIKPNPNDQPYVKEFERFPEDIKLKQDQCDIEHDNDRFDCFPDDYKTLNKGTCEKRGCCWKETVEIGAPYCFYPKIYPTYKVTGYKRSVSGYQANLTRDSPSIWPNDVKNLRIEVEFETNYRIHFKIFDPEVERFEVPVELPKREKHKVDLYDYEFSVENDPFSITISRKSNGNVIFSSKGVAPLIFADQFIQFGTQLSSHYLYGLGEARGPLLLDLEWTKRSFWATDSNPVINENLYGSHPFYLNIESDMRANGVFLLNSNAMQIDLQPTPALTYRTIGGILDFYVFTGPTPVDVIKQYTEVIGRPRMPPFWGLGFHLCRWGIKNTHELGNLIKAMRETKIPYDTQWNDIDYMYKHADFTVDDVNYRGLKSVVDDLHNHTQHYIMIIDPAISTEQPKGEYPAYDDGIKQGVFVMRSNGSGPIIGKVWPNLTVFPDFFSKNATNWWYTQLKNFHDKIPFDSLWIDMNEPSNFVSGSTDGCPLSRYNQPPFLPKLRMGTLFGRTLCPTAKHAVSTHYNLHNLYGFSESRTTAFAADKILNKRSIIISRSTFASSGRYASHWTGDNRASWHDLAASIPQILNFQMYGIPLVGADICGFGGNTTTELCTRWMQLGAFYPFMRNHNENTANPQDPAAFDKRTQEIMRSVTNIRYYLLPFLYTLFYHSHINGTPVIKPLFFNYPWRETLSIDRQFLWGDALLISPVLEKGDVNTTAYIPPGLWYDFYTEVPIKSSGFYMTLNAPIDKINLHVKEGVILPTLPPAVTTGIMRKQKFGLLVTLSQGMDSNGDLYWDDGDELNVIENNHYSYITFHCTKGSNSITSVVHKSGYKGAQLEHVKIYGAHTKPGTVTVNGEKVKFSYDAKASVLFIYDMSVTLLKPIIINF